MMSTLNTGRFYFSDTSNSHTQWEDPRKAGGAGDGIGGGLVAMLALAPIGFLAVAMFVRVMYLQVYYPEYLYPKRYRKMKKKGFGRNIQLSHDDMFPLLYSFRSTTLKKRGHPRNIGLKF